MAWVVLGLSIGAFLQTVYALRYTPPLQTDELIYHLAIPAHALGHGLFAPFTPWFHEPAPTYSPILMEMLIAALMAPVEGEVWARGVLLPFQFGIAFWTYLILRRLGVDRSLALIGACGSLVLRPFIRQTLSCQNDVALTCFFLMAVWSHLRWCERQTRARLVTFAAALGLMLATKYVAVLYAATLMVTSILERCFARSRVGGCNRTLTVSFGSVALSLGLLLLGSWSYLRNWIWTGNPMFPVEVTLFGWTLFPGQYRAAEVADYRLSLTTLQELFISGGTAYALAPVTGCVTVISGLVVPLGEWIRPSLHRRDRWLYLGWIPLLCTVGFVSFIPFGEQRLLFPVYALLWMTPFVLAQRWIERGPSSMQRLGQVAAAALVLRTAWESVGGLSLSPFVLLCGLLVPTLVSVCSRLFQRQLLRTAVYVGGVSAVISGVLFYVYGEAFAARYSDIRNFEIKYGELGRGWDWLDAATLESSAVVAHSGTPMTYPLYGRRLQNLVEYIHIAPGNHEYFHQYLDRPQTAGGSAIERANLLFREREDKAFWLDEIERRGVEILFVSRENGDGKMPIEASWAVEALDRFKRAFENSDVQIFRVLPAENQ